MEEVDLLRVLVEYEELGIHQPRRFMEKENPEC